MNLVMGDCTAYALFRHETMGEVCWFPELTGSAICRKVKQWLELTEKTSVARWWKR